MGLTTYICENFRPPIITNAPEGYIELMQKCWHSDPNKRPTASDLFNIFNDGGKLYYLKGNFYKCVRRAWIFSNNTYTRFPFQANTHGLPESAVDRCVLGFLNSYLNNKKYFLYQ